MMAIPRFLTPMCILGVLLSSLLLPVSSVSLSAIFPFKAGINMQITPGQKSQSYGYEKSNSNAVGEASQSGSKGCEKCNLKQWKLPDLGTFDLKFYLSRGQKKASLKNTYGWKPSHGVKYDNQVQYSNNVKEHKGIKKGGRSLSHFEKLVKEAREVNKNQGLYENQNNQIHKGQRGQRPIEMSQEQRPTDIGQGKGPNEMQQGQENNEHNQQWYKNHLEQSQSHLEQNPPNRPLGHSDGPMDYGQVSFTTGDNRPSHKEFHYHHHQDPTEFEPNRPSPVDLNTFRPADPSGYGYGPEANQNEIISYSKDQGHRTKGLSYWPSGHQNMGYNNRPKNWPIAHGKEMSNKYPVPNQFKPFPSSSYEAAFPPFPNNDFQEHPSQSQYERNFDLDDTSEMGPSGGKYNKGVTVGPLIEDVSDDGFEHSAANEYPKSEDRLDQIMSTSTSKETIIPMTKTIEKKPEDSKNISDMDILKILLIAKSLDNEKNLSKGDKTKTTVSPGTTSKPEVASNKNIKLRR